MKLTIRLKFLIVMSGLLLVCLAFYMLMSISVFKTDKTQLVYDLNKSQVTNLASEIETSLKGVSDSLRLFAQISEQVQEKMIESLFSEESDIIALSVFDQEQTIASRTYGFSDYFETYGIVKKDFFSRQKLSNIILNKIMKDGEYIWNASFEGAPPLIAYGKRVIGLDEIQRPIYQKVVVSYLKLDSLIKSVSILNLSEIKVSNGDGQVLVQRDVNSLFQLPNLNGTPLFEEAKGSNVKVSVTHVDIDGKGWLSAYAKAFDGRIIVTAKAPEEKVFQVVQALTVRTLLFGSIVLTLVILVAFLLSKSLTENIAILAKRMIGVSQGDLDSLIELRGQDETVGLGNAFNKMIFDLKKSRNELEVMNRELDQKVKDRTKELEIQNQKVVETQEALLRTTRLASMGEVAGRAAHEVLNPLTSLLTRAGLTQKRAEVNYLQPLELLDDIGQAWYNDYKEGGFNKLVKSWEEPSSVNLSQNLFLEDIGNLTAIRESIHHQASEIAKDMKFIKEEGDRIGKIIHGMRRLGNMNSEISTHSVHKLLDDCVYIMADLYDQQRIKIEKELSAISDRTDIDRDEFIQSITNMMRNSLQAMLEIKKKDLGFEAKLIIRTFSNEEFLFIDIIDNGVGVSRNHHAKLFSTDFTTKSSDEGTGLGLSISRRFIRNFEGDITFVESIPKIKTIFRIQLPLSKEKKGKAVA